ncbi:MAG: hypothetical protein ACRD6X_08940, partial [Pyrinomonadaceae bacterium]
PYSRTDLNHTQSGRRACPRRSGQTIAKPRLRTGMSAFHCTSPHVSKGGTRTSGQSAKRLERRHPCLQMQSAECETTGTQASLPAPSAECGLRTGMSAFLCTSPHVSKGDTLRPAGKIYKGADGGECDLRNAGGDL